MLADVRMQHMSPVNDTWCSWQKLAFILGEFVEMRE